MEPWWMAASPALLGTLTAAALIAIPLAMWWREGPRVERARGMLQKGAFLIDVDEPDEFAVEHIDGAKNIPLGDLARRAHEIGPFEHPVVVSGRGRLRSARAAHELRAIGFCEVLHVGRTHW